MSGERYTRWQSNAIAQLSFAVNLFLGLATALLGFSVSLILDEKFVLYGMPRYIFAVALLCQLISLLFGVVAVITRTLDFRFTAQIARSVEKEAAATGDEKTAEATRVASLRQRVKRLGSVTWFSFWTQIIFFTIGVLGLLTSIFIAYRHKIL